MMERLLIEEIAREFGMNIIKKLDTNVREFLHHHIKESIQNVCNYPHSEHIDEMINIAIEIFEDDLYALQYLERINYTISERFYARLDEPFFDSCDWEDEFEKPFDEIRLNRYTLLDYIDFGYCDAAYKLVELFEKDENWINHKHRQDILERIDESKRDYIAARKDQPGFTELSNREEILITTNVLLAFNRVNSTFLKKQILDGYKIDNNTNELNQQILNDSYDVIIEELSQYKNTQKVLEALRHEKANNNDLFTGSKRRLAQLKRNNHYMSFLYQCSSVYSIRDSIVFQEFVEAMISGYLQYIELQNSQSEVKNLSKDLEVLKRYNESAENEKNIELIEQKIMFFSVSKPLYRLIPFKELSNRLDIDKMKIANYIKKRTAFNTNKQTVKKHFETLTTLPKEVCISKY